MHRLLRPLAGLALAALLVATPGLALAHGEGPRQTVDGYTVTFALPEQGFSTGRNPVAVNLWDWRGDPPAATLHVQPLVFMPVAAHGHGAADHTADAADAADVGNADDGHGHAPDADHAADAGNADDGHDHSGDSALEGRGLALAPVALALSEEPGEYRGELTFDEAGTYTVGVVFTVDGVERGAIFEVAVAQRRPRALVLGGFALINGLAIGVAGWLRYRAPQQPARKPAHPVANATAEEESR